MDYSKWDSLEISDDEEEKTRPIPKVTRLDNPSSITFGGGKTGAKGAKPIEVHEGLAHKGSATATTANSGSGSKSLSAEKLSLPAPPVQASSSNTTKTTTAVKKNPSSSNVKKTTASVSVSTKVNGSLASNYSKWDKFEVSDSENDEDEYDSNDEDYEAIDDDGDEQENMESEAEEQARLGKELGPPKPEPPSQPGPKARLDKDLDINNQELCYRNGSNALLEKYGYVWSQTKQTVSLFIIVPLDTKGKDIFIEATKWHLTIKLKRSDVSSSFQTVIDGKLAYPIEAPDDVKKESKKNGGGDDLVDTPSAAGSGKKLELDWELKYGINSACTATAFASDGGNVKDRIRLLCVTLVKRAPSKEITVWWQNVIADHKGGNVNLDQMPDRSTASQSLFQKNWNEAHIMFQEKVKKIEKVVIDTSRGEGEEMDTEDGPSEGANNEQDSMFGDVSTKSIKEKVVEMGSDQAFDLDATS